MTLMLSVSIAAFDSGNISKSEWHCNPTVNVHFEEGGGIDVHCGTEIFWAESQTQPVITYSPALPNLAYAVIIVDRDADLPDGPSVAPIRHFAIANISGEIIRNGFSGSLNASGVQELTPYRGPQPPANTSCHRYYVMVYRQNSSDQIIAVPPSLPNWDFPSWARNYTLVKVAVNYFQTQNAETRTSACVSSEPNGLSPGAVVGIVVGVIAVNFGIGLIAFFGSRHNQKEYTYVN